MIPTEWTTQRWKNNADCTGQKQRDNSTKMGNDIEKEMLMTLLRMRDFEYIMSLYVYAKTEGVEEEYKKIEKKHTYLNEYSKLDNFYAETIINKIFEED